MIDAKSFVLLQISTAIKQSVYVDDLCRGVLDHASWVACGYYYFLCVRANSRRCRPHLARPPARSSASVYIRSAKRNIRNECAILIRRVKGTLREECGYTPCVCRARVTSPWNARASISAHATRDYSPRRVVGRKRVRGRATGTPERENSFDRDVCDGIRNDPWRLAYEMSRTGFII